MRIPRASLVRPSPLVSLLLSTSAVSWLGYGTVLAHLFTGSVDTEMLAGLGMMLPGDIFVTWMALAQYRRQVLRARRQDRWRR